MKAWQRESIQLQTKKKKKKKGECFYLSLSTLHYLYRECVELGNLWLDFDKSWFPRTSLRFRFWCCIIWKIIRNNLDKLCWVILKSHKNIEVLKSLCIMVAFSSYFQSNLLHRKANQVFKQSLKHNSFLVFLA